MPFEESLGQLTTLGVTTVVSLIEQHETRNDLDQRYRAAGLAVLRYPIRDYCAPADAASFAGLLEDVATRLAAGERIYVHCIGGLGRTGTLLATWFVDRGMTADEAIAFVRAARPGSIESLVQEDSVHRYELSLP